MALCEAQLFCVLSHHATQTFGLCAMVLTQVKAFDLVRAFDPLTACFTKCSPGFNELKLIYDLMTTRIALQSIVSLYRLVAIPVC